MTPKIGLCLWNPDAAQNEWDGAVINLAKRAPLGLLGRMETVYPHWLRFDIAAGEDHSYLALMGSLRGLTQTPDKNSLCRALLQKLTAGEDLAALLFDLEGEFGLAWWNAANHTLTLACDQVGHLPLYFSTGKGGVAWSAHPKPLGMLRGEISLDPVALEMYLELRGIPAPYCLIQGVHKICAGWITEIGPGGQKQRPYFNFDPPQAAGGTLESASDQLHNLLKNSINRQVAGFKGPIGIFLSGGLDSSLLLAVASKTHPDIRAFSVGYQIPTRTDETAYAAATARYFNIPCEVLRVSSAEIVEIANEKAGLLPEPVADITIFPELLLANRARETVSFVLDGTGADGLFGGSEKYIADHYVGHWLKIPRLIRRMLLLPLLNKLPASRRWRLTNMIRKAKILANGAELSPLERLIYWSIFIPKDQIKRLLKAKTLEGKDSAGIRFLQGLYPSSSYITLSQKSAATLQSSLPWIEIHKLQALEKLSGLSIGNPFLTPQIIQFGLGLPDEYKVSGKNGKIVLRMLAKDLVPPPILRRKKANFSPPITEWMNAELGEAVRSLLFSPHSLFEAPIVRQMIDQNQSGMADWRSEIWALYILQLWWDKTRLDGQELYGNYSV